MSKLTPKQELFCQNVVAGMSYKDSYIKAYNCESIQAAYVEGSKLGLREDIQERIKALQKPIEDALKQKGLTAREKQISAIEDRIAVCIEKEDETSLIRYYDMLNKIYALYKEAEEKKENDNSLTNLDTSTLEKIARIG